MPQINWNEVKDRSIRFSREWAEAKSEQADKQTFWNEFFEVFGIRRRAVATFEAAVAREKGTYGFIDLIWPGQMVVEQKSRGASLSKAESQAFDYCEDLMREGRHDDLPRFIILCDFARFAIYDLEPDAEEKTESEGNTQPFRYLEFNLKDLHKHVREFAFIRGEKPMKLTPEHPANMKATQLLADFHDALEETGYTGHALERYLVRCLFCLFAEDTGVFDPFTLYVLINKSKQDGSDLGARLAQLWDVLNTPEDKRQKTLDEDLAAFPYVNGGLFAEPLPICSFNSKLRDRLLECSRFFWARISPAVFGSIFQGVMDDKERRQIGAHYTSERDIMKLIKGLFLDDLQKELKTRLADRSNSRNARLKEFQDKLRSLRFFDPACGCGNFLIIAYREVRHMEQKALVALHTIKGKKSFDMQRTLDVRDLSKVDVDQFYGIEIGEWPVRIAEVGLWLADHQCNLNLGEALGQTFRRLPLKATPTLKIANALRTDWREVLPPTDNVYVLGNPPFVGKKEKSAEQKADMKIVWGDVKVSGVLDYVTAWYRKAADYIQNSHISCAFVSTNSISQGEQVGVLWNCLFTKHGIKIHFAHRTFAWASEARGKAHVHVVIIGFGAFDRTSKEVFEYDHPNGNAVVASAKNINPYLIDGSDIVVSARSKPIDTSLLLVFGSKATDGGNLLLTEEEHLSLLQNCSEAKQFVRKYISAAEYLHSIPRYCLWLIDAKPSDWRHLKPIADRVAAVRDFRLKSNKPKTRDDANISFRFAELRQPTSQFIAIPKTTSERRSYIPISFLNADIKVASEIYFAEGASLYHLGMLTSAFHMAWMRTVAGRLKSDYRYSNKLVYNNFPWPENISDKNQQAVETAAQAVLDARKQYPDSTLADLYDPLSMPAPLVKAHTRLDRIVDRCYRTKKFQSDRERVEHLFKMYEKLTAPLVAEEKGKKRGRKTQ